MYNILIITHGTLASALKDTLKMFTSDLNGIHAVGLTETGIDEFKVEVMKAIGNCYEEGKELLIMADLFGGTPFNVAMLEVKNKYEAVEVITGVNLPLLVEGSLLRSSNLQEIIETLKESAQSSIIIPETSKSCEDDE